MKAVICTRPFSLEVADRAEPARRPGEVLLRIRRVGLCGTDYHIYAGRQPFLEYPRVMGHELAGEVVETDPGSPLATGQLVTVNPYLACGTCRACRREKPNCCTAISVLGVHADGGLSEYISVPESAVIPVGALSSDQAAMVEFLSVGAHAVRRAAVRPDDRVLVTGAGPIGVAVALFARMRGAAPVLLDVSAERLARAQDSIDLADALAVDDATEERLRDLTGGDYFDVVFDATGNAAAMEKGFGHVAYGGTYVLVSVVKDDIRFADPEFHKREMTLMGSRNATMEDFHHVIDCIAGGHVPTQALNTHAVPALDLPRCLPELIAGQGSVIKAIAAF